MTSAIQLNDGLSDATKADGLINGMWKVAMLFLDGCAPSTLGAFDTPNACALYICIVKNISESTTCTEPKCTCDLSVQINTKDIFL